MATGPDPNASPYPNASSPGSGKVLGLGLFGGALAGGLAALGLIYAKVGQPPQKPTPEAASPASAVAANPSGTANTPAPSGTVPGPAVDPAASAPAAKLGFRMGDVNAAEKIDNIKVTLLVGDGGDALEEAVDLHLGFGFPLRLYALGGDSRTPAFAAFPQQTSLPTGTNKVVAGGRATFEFQSAPTEPGADKLRTTPQLLSDLTVGDVRGIGFASRGTSDWELAGYTIEINGKLFAADDSLQTSAAASLAEAQSELDRLWPEYEVLAKEKSDLDAYVATGLASDDDKKALATKAETLAKSAEPINRLAAKIAGASPWYEEQNPAFKPAAAAGDHVKWLEVTLITAGDRPGSRNPVYLSSGGRKYLLASEADPLSDEPVRQRFKLSADELAAAPLAKDKLTQLGIGMVGNDQRFGKVPDRAKLQRVIVEADGEPAYDSETVAGDRQTLEAIWLIPPAHRDDTGKEVVNAASPTELFVWKAGSTVDDAARLAPPATPAAEPPATEPIAGPLQQPLPNDSNADPFAGVAPAPGGSSGTGAAPDYAAAPGAAQTPGTGQTPGAGQTYGTDPIVPGGATAPGAPIVPGGIGVGGNYGGPLGAPQYPGGIYPGAQPNYGLLPPIRRYSPGQYGLPVLPGIVIGIPGNQGANWGGNTGGGTGRRPGGGGVPPAGGGAGGAVGGGGAAPPVIPPVVPAPAVPTISNVRLNPNLAILRNGDTATVNWQVVGNASQVTSYRVDLFAVMPHLTQPLLAPAVSTRANVTPPAVAAAGGAAQSMTAITPAISTASLTINGAPLTPAQLCYLYVQPKVTALGPGGTAELTSAFGPLVPLSIQGTLPIGVALSPGVAGVNTFYSYFQDTGTPGPRPYAGQNDPGISPSAWLPGSDTASHNALTFAAFTGGGSLPGGGATYFNVAARPTINGTQRIAVKFEGSVVQPAAVVVPAAAGGPKGYRVVAHVGLTGGNLNSADNVTVQSRVQVGFSASPSIFTPIGAAEDFFRMESSAPMPVPRAAGAGPAPMLLIDMPIRFDKFANGTANTDQTYFDTSKYQVSNWNNALFQSQGQGRVVALPGGGVLVAPTNYVSVTYMISLATTDPSVAVGIFGVRLVPDNSP